MLKKVILVLLGLILLAGVAGYAPFLWRDWVWSHYGGAIYAPEKTPPRPVAIVFGARVYESGRLSSMVRDRVETAVRLVEAGTVKTLIMSGDNHAQSNHEPERMRDYAISRGVPAEAIQIDGDGLRTYDSCYRARHFLGVDSAVLVTQSFHLPRALFLCRSLGIDAVGSSADLRVYSPRSLAWSEAREVPALVLALWDVMVAR